MYERFKRCKKKVQMILDSVLDEQTPQVQCNYVKFWLGEEGLPLIQKWEDTGNIDTY